MLVGGAHQHVLQLPAAATQATWKVAHLDNIVPVQHKVSILCMSAQIRCVRHQEAKVCLQELVAVVGLLTAIGKAPTAAITPSSPLQYTTGPMVCVQLMQAAALFVQC